MPQARPSKPRTVQEQRDFNRMLKNVNLVYLGARCLLLIGEQPAMKPVTDRYRYIYQLGLRARTR